MFLTQTLTIQVRSASTNHSEKQKSYYFANYEFWRNISKGKQAWATSKSVWSQQTQAKESFRILQYLDASVGPWWAPCPQQILQVPSGSHWADFPMETKQDYAPALHFHSDTAFRTLSQL